MVFTFFNIGKFVPPLKRLWNHRFWSEKVQVSRFGQPTTTENFSGVGGGGGVPYLCLFKIALWFICDSTGSQLYSLMHYFSFRDQYMSFNDLNRPQSGLSFFPTLSFAHSLPPLGEWCREVVRSRQWDRDIMVKENRNKSARRRLSRIPEVWVLTMMTKLKLLRIPSWQF